MSTLKGGLLAVVTLLVLASAAQAAPEMAIDMKAWKDVVVVENGKQVKKRVEATEQAAGEVIIFTIDYSNGGDEKATDIKVDNPVPPGTRYVVDSASGNAEILFSIDQGKTYKQPALLTYEVKDKNGKPVQMKASPEAITHIRWLLKEVPPGGKGRLGYQVRVE